MTVKTEYYLVRIINGREVECVQINKEITTIGRANTQDIRCLSLNVSREHCTVHIKDNEICIRDMGSSNGTFVEDKRISSDPCVVQDGSLIGLGGQPDDPAPFVFKLFITDGNSNKDDGNVRLPMLGLGRMFKNLKRGSSELNDDEFRYIPLAKKSNDGRQHIINVDNTSQNNINGSTTGEKQVNKKEAGIIEKSDGIEVIVINDDDDVEHRSTCSGNPGNGVSQNSLTSNNVNQSSSIGNSFKDETHRLSSGDLELEIVEGNSKENCNKPSIVEEIQCVDDVKEKECTDLIQIEDDNAPAEDSDSRNGELSFSLNDEIITIDDSDDEEPSQLLSQCILFDDSKVDEIITIKSEPNDNNELYDDEDQLLDESSSGKFEEHFIHCSQDIVAEDEIESKPCKPDEEVKEDIFDEHENQKDNIHIKTDSVLEEISGSSTSSSSSSFVSINDKPKCDKQPSKTSLKKQLEDVTEEVEKSLIKGGKTKSFKKKELRISLIKLEDLKKEKKANKSKKEVKHDEKSNEKDCRKSKRYERDKGTKVESPQKEQQKKDLKKVIDTKLENIKRKTIQECSTKVAKGSRRKVDTKKEVKTTVKERSNKSELSKLRREKLKMIALKNKPLDDGKVGQGSSCVPSEDVGQSTSAAPNEQKNIDATNVKDTVRVSDRSKGISCLIPLDRVQPKEVKKTRRKEIDKKKKASTSLKQEPITNRNHKELERNQGGESLKERLKTLKEWEQGIINSMQDTSLDLPNRTSLTGRGKVTKKVVTFSTDLVQVQTYECDTILRKCSDKENRRRREMPPQKKTLIQFAWKAALRSSSVIFDLCKWNVVWLEESKTITGDPPVVKMQYLYVKDSYISYRDYWNTMYPLLMLETWKETCNDLELQDNGYRKRTFNGIAVGVKKNPPCYSQDNSDKKSIKHLVTVNCAFVGSREECRRPLVPDEGDFGIMFIVSPTDGKKKQVYKTFVFVSSRFKCVPYHNCNDRFVNYLVNNLNDHYLKNEVSTCIYVQLTFCDSLNKPISEGCHLKLRIIRNIYKNLRIFDSLNQLQESILVNQILNPRSIERPKTNNEYSSGIVSEFPLNESQVNVVLNITKDLLSSAPSISLIHGPPGTGKTRVVVSIVQQLLSEKQKSKKTVAEKILLCAPSNAAVDSLVLRLLELRQSLPNDKRFKLIRVGPPHTIHKGVKEISSYNLAEKEVGTQLDADNLNIELKLLIAEERSISYSVEALSSNDERKKKFSADLASVQEKRRNLEYLVRDSTNGTQAKLAHAKLVTEAEMKVIQCAEIIATTLSSCCCRKIINALSEQQYCKFAYCIVDEATQGIEQEVLFPLMHNIKRLVLVGDPLQLAPTVISESAKKYDLGRSLYHRIWREWESDDTNGKMRPFYKLTIQNRMHPEIAYFPAKYFYNNNLTTPEFLNVQLPFLPYNVLAHGFKQEPDGESNGVEAKLVVKILASLYKSSSFKGLSIGVIVPYNRQKHLIEGEISALNEEIKYTKVNTIDSFQGQEKDVIIFSCVRTEGIGFLGDRLRINVALTRARKCLIVLGNFSSLQGDATWRGLINDAKDRGLLHDIPPSITESQQLVDLLMVKEKRRRSRC